jgi:thiamine biosynthesis lipoprotein
VNASGDITLGDPPPGREGWGVGVAPLDASREPSRIVNLCNCGVATSGDAWQAVVIDGIRYSHILDPKTGIGLTQRSSVTVVAPNGTLADAWASAVSVLGPADGVALVEELEGIETLVVYLDGEETRVAKSERFPVE